MTEQQSLWKSVNMLHKTFVIICLILTAKMTKPLQMNEILYNDIFLNYGKNVLPYAFNETSNKSIPIDLKLKPSLYSILDLNEADETLTVTLWFIMTWRDARLKWNPDDYQGITSILVPDNLVWLPDVKLYQMLKSEISDIVPFYVTISNEGQIYFSKTVVITTHCPLDVTDFPYDIQTCNMVYVCWLHTGQQIILKSMTGENGDLSVFQNGSEWILQAYTLKEVDVVYATGVYYEIHCSIVLKRNPGYYLLTLTFPSFLITTLALIGLFSPFQATQQRQEKVMVGLTALLTIAVILMMVADLMPKNSIDFPLLGDYILIEMMLISFATIVAVGIMYLHSQATFGRHVPTLLLYFTLQSKSKPRSVDSVRDDRKRESVIRVEGTSTKCPADIDAQETAKILNAIHSSVKRLLAKLEKEEEVESLTNAWMKTCYRLDLLCLFMFMSVQIVMSAVYSKVFV